MQLCRKRKRRACSREKGTKYFGLCGAAGELGGERNIYNMFIPCMYFCSMRGKQRGACGAEASSWGHRMPHEQMNEVF